ncbi:MAG TPA: STAS domain-containing protein [Candidatus Acidoferrales bacterium]
METVMGVFTSRDQAEQALKHLAEKGIPEREIVFLSRSESEAVAVGKDIGATAGGLAGGAVGLGTGMVVASLALIPGLGQVFAVGVGAAAVLGYLGKRGGEKLGHEIGKKSEGIHAVSSDALAQEDAETFLEVLREGRSLVVVRTDSAERAKAAAAVLDAGGVAAPAHAPDRKMHAGVRRVSADVTAVDVKGRVVIGDGNMVLRETIQKLVEGGNRRVLLVMEEVEHIDSSGIGELVRAHTLIRRASGRLKIVKPSAKVHEMLQMTMLHKVLEVHPDEASAIAAFEASGAAAKA